MEKWRDRRDFSFFPWPSVFGWEDGKVEGWKTPLVD